MLVLIWAILSVSKGASSEVREFCSYYSSQYCITLPVEDITAEAGLCVVIPCSFTTYYYFDVQELVWLKCETTQSRCDDADVIFKSNRNIRSEFRGRVSLLEPQLSRRNCSIAISDLRESDSGSYQLRVNGYLNGRMDKWLFYPKATISVKGLSQKPSVTVPLLTAGQPATLTCTAPGLCSGSDPKITWAWRRAGEEGVSDITGNATAHRRSSSLTFNPTAEHHGTNITCKVTFSGGTTAEEKVTLIVSYVKAVRITESQSVNEGEALNLTCSVESFPAASVSWSKMSHQNAENQTGASLHNLSEGRQREQSATAALTFSSVTPEDAGQYVCTVKHLNDTFQENVTVTVIYVREPVITGETTVREGESLNVTCSVDSFPPSLVTWTKHGVGSDVRNSTALLSDTGTATLIIPRVTREHSGRYVCTAEHLEKTATAHPDVTVTWFSKMLKTFGCEAPSDVLTCVCVCEGSPPPAITWPLLKHHTEHSTTTAVSGHTVHSTITLSVTGRDNMSVECVGANEAGEAKQNLTVRLNSSPPPAPPSKTSRGVPWLEAIVAFLIGVVISTTIFCLAQRFHRRKQRSHANLDETLEMGAENGSVAAENGGPSDVEYANIDFSRLKRNKPKAAPRKEETSVTEYAEIKKQAKVEKKDEVGERDEGEGEEAVMAEDEQTRTSVPEDVERDDDDMAVYSNVKEIMAEK